MSETTKKCLQCGADLIIKDEEVAGICDKCGMPFFNDEPEEKHSEVVKQVAKSISQENTLSNEDNSFNTLQKKAIIYFKLNDYTKARKTCQKIVNYFPEIVFGWYGIARAVSHDFTSKRHYDVCYKNLQKAISLSSQKELKFIKDNAKGFEKEATFEKHKKISFIQKITKFVGLGCFVLLSLLFLIGGFVMLASLNANSDIGFLGGNTLFTRSGASTHIIVGGIMMIIVGGGIGLYFALRKRIAEARINFDSPLERTDFGDDTYINAILKEQTTPRRIVESDVIQKNGPKVKTVEHAPKKLPSDILDDLPFEEPKPRRRSDFLS